MNKIFISFLCFFAFNTINAQIYEIGAFLGGSNYVGDVGSTNYINPNEPAFGVLFKWNKTARHAFRVSYTQSRISSNDLQSEEPSRNQRGYNFKNNIKELSAGLEFNFFEFNLHDPSKQITPYIYSGISYFFYNDLQIASGQMESSKINSSIAIPMTIGIKSNISPYLILSLEVGARYTFTDNIDGSNPKNQNLPKFGNINNNDWYVFSGLSLTYTFGNKPCYCTD